MKEYDIKIKFVDGFAEVYTDYNADYVAELRTRIKGAWWLKDKRCWRIPEDAVETCRELLQKYYGMTNISTEADIAHSDIQTRLDLKDLTAPEPDETAKLFEEKERLIARIEEIDSLLLASISLPFADDTKIIKTKLAGVTYDNRQDNISLCREGDLLNMIREPGNPYDHNAIRVEDAGKMLGYIPTALAASLAQYMDDGNDIINCRIKEITGGGDLNYGVNISVEILDI